MSEKVKLPHDVAKAIETLRGRDFIITNHDIIYAFAASKSDEYPALIEYASEHFDDLLKALVNGYEVEETPEEKVKKLFEKYIPGTDKNYGYRLGVCACLNALDIKIEGINK